MAGLDQRLEDLLIYPREDLDIEIKSWLDLDKNEDRANLAKALIALTNYGGGYVLLGFEEVEGIWKAAEPHPTSLTSFSQDSVNGVVAAYAEPAFHCSVSFLGHPTTGRTYPVIRVSGGSVPVRTRRGCPCGCVKENTYFVRRPGPSSESPRSAQEWDQLIGKCVRANRTSLMEDIRAIVIGSAGTPPPAQGIESLDGWISESRARWNELVQERLPNENPSRYRHGVWYLAYRIAGLPLKPSLTHLRDYLRGAEVRLTGWPEWMIFENTFVPQPFGQTLECLVVGGNLDDVGHSDYWRVSQTGEAFLLRGYQEDSTPPHEPGTLFSVTTPIWRVAEAVLHASALSKAFGARRSVISMRVTWEGLRNRILFSFEPGADWRRSRTCHQDAITIRLDFDPEKAADTLEELITESLAPLYEAFDLFSLSRGMVAKELAEMMGRRAS